MDTYAEFIFKKEAGQYLIENMIQNKKSFNENALARVESEMIPTSLWDQIMHLISNTCTWENANYRTKHLVVVYFRLFTLRRPTNKLSILKLIACTCLSLAFKYEENREIESSKKYDICEQKFSLEVINETELYVLKVLEWKLDKLTSSEILYYLFDFLPDKLEINKIYEKADSFVFIAVCDYHISNNASLDIAVAGGVCALINCELRELADDWLSELEKKDIINASLCRSIAESMSAKAQTSIKSLNDI